MMPGKERACSDNTGLSASAKERARVGGRRGGLEEDSGLCCGWERDGIQHIYMAVVGRAGVGLDSADQIPKVDETAQRYITRKIQWP